MFPLFLIFTLLMMPLYGIKVPNAIFYENERKMENHPGDFPFPTDLTFSNFANHKILATTKEFHPSKVKRGDTIYIKDRYISWFIKEVHPKINEPYILISSDSDDQHPYLRKDIEILLYDSKMAAWFCKNMILSRHPKIFQIPIGQNIVYWGFFPEKDQLLKMANTFIEKEYLLYINMQLASDKSREKVAKLLGNESYALSRINYKDPTTTDLKRINFYNELAKAYYVAAPRGYGIDTARFWEAITLNTIPILQHSPLDDLYENTASLIIHDWEEINESLLKEQLQTILSKNFSKEKAYFPFWEKKIKEIQNKIRAKENFFSSLEATKFDNETFKNLLNIIQENLSKSFKHIICKGKALGLRPYELAKTFPEKKVYTIDDWNTKRRKKNVLKKLSQNSLLENNIKELSAKKNLMATLSSLNEPFCFFFDLSYYRHSLEDEFTFYHKKILNNSLICGNCADDTFVKEVLCRLEKKLNLKFTIENNIWFLKK